MFPWIQTNCRYKSSERVAHNQWFGKISVICDRKVLKYMNNVCSLLRDDFFGNIIVSKIVLGFMKWTQDFKVCIRRWKEKKAKSTCLGLRVKKFHSDCCRHILESFVKFNYSLSLYFFHLKTEVDFFLVAIQGKSMQSVQFLFAFFTRLES